MQCPYTYANGRQCTGEVYRARAYGKHDGCGRVERQNIRKIRLWCSDRGDHVGAIRPSSLVYKERMEFYPDELEGRGLLAEAISLCDNISKAGR
jgi:hypothetical protein